MGFFQVWAIINKAAANMCLKTFVWKWCSTLAGKTKGHAYCSYGRSVLKIVHYIILLLIITVYVSLHLSTCAMYRSEDNFEMSFLPFHPYVNWNSGHQACVQVTMLLQQVPRPDQFDWLEIGVLLCSVFGPCAFQPGLNENFCCFTSFVPMWCCQFLEVFNRCVELLHLVSFPCWFTKYCAFLYAFFPFIEAKVFGFFFFQMSLALILEFEGAFAYYASMILKVFYLFPAFVSNLGVFLIYEV